ncbi:hypothetical protein GYH30_017538 [Glycine max]|uniref:Uncharacterized protein n=1 Tax=Glycine max TaxID=3847 RepID=K7KZW8_SOYBN|nr:hypothetical protein GYH30_017538 [Glycine max]
MGNYKLEDSFMNELEGASLVADGQDSLVSKLILTGCYSVTNTYLFLIENTNLLMSFSTGHFGSLPSPTMLLSSCGNYKKRVTHREKSVM